MNLLIDVGNSRIKWLLSQNAEVMIDAEIHSVKTIDALVLAWETIAKPHRLAISNVTGIKRTEQIVKLAERLWPGIEVIIAQTTAYAIGVSNAYAQPENLGVDRWLVLLAINRFHQLPAIIVDCGTAITVDVLAVDGKHQGGLIIPGLNLMKKSLQQGAHRLQYTDNVAQTDLGISTPSGIANGALMSVLGLIEKLYQQLTEAEGAAQNLILTGGDAQLIAQHIAINAKVDKYAVLQGLALLIDE